MRADQRRPESQDLTRISLDPDHISYWTNRFGVSQDEIEEAVEAVGDSADAVAAYLGAPRAR
ncbi:MAG: DUF3606 domain-containing protein [Leeuwenhoekiella sp.]|jgi:hypothetical protein|uniref:DUF3606 domain-containing protein n=1 Tax=Sphingobium sp. C100 TaxID=1207055 RepID=UPI0003D61E30|nr:DUF3606 domain-containing protein [Sphingobium sp. C100]ETI65708.1 hypothetical protein C100_00820 [Sphingobium sp. C100]PHR98141.1 MAG: DUF3606 domain-containing protein [Leeuwenhoekiella sp.]